MNFDKIFNNFDQLFQENTNQKDKQKIAKSIIHEVGKSLINFENEVNVTATSKTTSFKIQW